MMAATGNMNRIKIQGLSLVTLKSNDTVIEVSSIFSHP
jgi:hypothetical protein